MRRQLLLSDDGLAMRARAGDAAARGELVERWAPRLFAFTKGLVGRRSEVEDICQDVLLAVLAGLGRFEVEDELYFRQHGEEPIEPLMHARSERTGADEPLLWTYDHGRARVVQCLLGHDAKTYETPQARVLARRIVAWCARRALHGPADGP